MMSKAGADDFVRAYSRFYFDNEISNIEKEKYKVPKNLKTAKSEGRSTDENTINEEMIKGNYTASSIAWKLGTKLKDNGDIDHRYYKYKEKDINFFCEKAKRAFDESKLKTSVYSYENRFDFYKCIRELYAEILELDLPGKGFGAVQIINAIYFISAGKVPIYDQYAHKAALALTYNCSPDEISLESGISKSKVDFVICMYRDYMELLTQVFPDKIYATGNQYISRELDQALWVYGHCTRNWYEVRSTL